MRHAAAMSPGMSVSLGGQPLDIVFLQTADPYRYKRMLDATARTAIQYCERHGYAYESYVGIKRGYFPWHATFNRMFQLRELIDRGFRGWAVYLDADAYVNDLDFDLAAYLTARANRAGIMTTIPGEPHPWCINAGVLLLNLGHAVGREIAELWLGRYLDIDDADLRTMAIWDDGNSDQSMLFEILHHNPHLRAAIEYDDGQFINAYQARFIRQLLRSLSPDLETRTRELETVTGSLVAAQPVASSVVSALYRALLQREPDEMGLAAYVNHVAIHGVEEGTRFVADEIIHSEEYRRLKA